MHLIRPERLGLLALMAGLLSIYAQAAEAPTSSGLRLISPVDYQVQQRLNRNFGDVVVAGTLASFDEVEGVLETRLEVGGAAAEWRQLSVIANGATGFRATLTAPTGGWYRLDVRVRVGDRVITEASVPHVGVGEVFVVAGQSNSANHGEVRQRTETEMVAAFHDGQWQLANDPQPGASGNGGSFMPPFGDAIARRFNVPVGFFATGVGATSVREWLPQGTRFPNPPTLTGNVTQLATGEWESKGMLFDQFVKRLKEAGPKSFRAVLWHQGESDAKQRDATRTLSGEHYAALLEQLIRDSRREVGWEFPWFVAQASYHSPDDAGSSDIREAQAAVWKSGVALEGPNSDALTGRFRDSDGKGVHFSGEGLREHGARWAEKVSPWLEQELANASQAGLPSTPPAPRRPVRLALPDAEEFAIDGRSVFIFLPPPAQRSDPQPWIFYAPTLPGLPDEAERWMHEQFLAAGIAVVGIDVGEGYGSPQSNVLFDALHQQLTEQRGFAPKPCLLGRSRGGLWLSSWAIAHPERVAGIAGIYPVFDLRSYPGVSRAAPAFGLTGDELSIRIDEFNPIARIGSLAEAGVPAFLIHGDQDAVVPLPENSGEFVRRYHEAGGESLVKLIVLAGQGHNFFEGFFHSQELVDFAVSRARAGAKP